VDAARTRATPNPDLALQAQALIRSLSGVASAHVLAGPAGIDAIHVVAADQGYAESLPRNVRSALLAALATSVAPARIVVRLSGSETTRNGHQDDSDPGDTLLRIVGDRATALPPAPDALAHEADTATGHRARLVAVDVDRPDYGPAQVRVSIAWNAEIHHGDAIARATDASGADAAVRATLQAFDRAGLGGLRLEGLRQVELGDRDYFVVALSHQDDIKRYRSGSAPCSISPERTAVEATISAAHELV
jgi:hypothetical protein